MALLSVAVTVLITCAAPAALGLHQSLTWASGRYLDGMTVTFFLVGAVVLLRAAARPILAFAACVAGFVGLAAVTVAVYAGTSLPTERGRTFNFGEPAVLTQNWRQASVLVATAAALGLLLVWVYFAILARYLRILACVLGAAVAAVSLVAVAQLTAHGSRADGAWAKAMGVREMAAAGGLKPGELAGGPGRLAGRRGQPVRRLGRLAQVKRDSGSGDDGDRPVQAPGRTGIDGGPGHAGSDVTSRQDGAGGGARAGRRAGCSGGPCVRYASAPPWS